MNPLEACVAAFDRYLARATPRSTKADMTSGDLAAGGKAPPAILGGPKKKKPPVAKLIEGAQVFTPIGPVRKATGKAASYQGISLEIDRPKGFIQEGKDQNGKPWTRLYRYDYGFVPRTEGGDGEGLDVFLGPSPNAHTSWWAIQTKDDGAGGAAFDEFKVFLGFSSPSLAKSCYAMHIPVKFCAGWFPVPVAFMRSLLGVEPMAVIKARMRKALAS